MIEPVRRRKQHGEKRRIDSRGIAGRNFEETGKGWKSKRSKERLVFEATRFNRGRTRKIGRGTCFAEYSKHEQLETLARTTLAEGKKQMREGERTRLGAIAIFQPETKRPGRTMAAERKEKLQTSQLRNKDQQTGRDNELQKGVVV